MMVLGCFLWIKYKKVGRNIDEMRRKLGEESRQNKNAGLFQQRKVFVVPLFFLLLRQTFLGVQFLAKSASKKPNNQAGIGHPRTSTVKMPATNVCLHSLQLQQAHHITRTCRSFNYQRTASYPAQGMHATIFDGLNRSCSIDRHDCN
jgi:ribosomal protein L32